MLLSSGDRHSQGKNSQKQTDQLVKERTDLEQAYQNLNQENLALNSKV